MEITKAKINKNISRFYPLVGIFLLFLFLPGQSYYEQLQAYSSPDLVPLQFDYVDLPSVWQDNFSLLPAIEAEAALLQDFDSGQILFAKNTNKRLPPASVTKILTAMVVLEEMDLQQTIVVSQPEYYGQVMGLPVGEKIKTEKLLHALLVMSANDAAYALADAYPGGRTAFIAAMNRKAESLGMSGSHFVNPNGQDNPAHFTTASDLARLTNYALKKERFREIVKTKEEQICSQTGRCYVLTSTNELLENFPGILGVKTGWTEIAGECFIAFWERDDRRFISVVLNSSDRFGETANLLGWSQVNFSSQPVNFFTLLFESN